MWHILRAFAWMRWRVLVNSLERTGARDTLERLSIGIEQIGPLMAAVMLVPSMLVLAGLGLVGGYALATARGTPLAFTILRYVTLGATVLGIIGPITMPATERTNAVRLLLLPIPRALLYVGQTASTLGDPWILLIIPVAFAIPIGLTAGGAPVSAAFALVAGLLFLVVLIGLSVLTTNVIHLLVRNRRRGEMLALLFVLIIPAANMIVHLLDERQDRNRRASARGAPHESTIPPWVEQAGERAYTLLPSELYATATHAGLREEPVSAGAALAGLLATAGGLQILGALAFSHLLDTPSTTGSRRALGRTQAWGTRVPGLSAGASAVALAQIRLAYRTPRGRSVLLMPLLIFVMFTVMMMRGTPSFSFPALRSGLGLATAVGFFSLLALLPLALNQFAIDRSGLTLAFLSPLSDSELLAGKAVGNAAIAAGPALAGLVMTFLMFREGAPALWLSIPLGLAATYLVAVPLAAVASVLLPKPVDLNSIGRGSNAHGLAGVIGLATFALAGLPPLGLALAASRLLQRPSLAPILVGLWCVLAFVLCRLLLIPVGRLLAARRENLAIIASGAKDR